MDVRKLALVSVMIPLITVLTMVFIIPIPATQGYFNFGDTGVILFGMLFGPYIGFITGGLGSSLAGILLGYSYYAPGTLLAKGGEGLLVGFIFTKFRKRSKILAYTSGPVGGLFMISWYFIYENFFLNFGLVRALSEVPSNILQALLGSVIAYSLFKVVYPLIERVTI